jgi:hypothetical protein
MGWISMAGKSLWEIYKEQLFDPPKSGTLEVGVAPYVPKTLYEVAAQKSVNDMLDAAKDQISVLTSLFAGGYLALISIGDIDNAKDIIGDLEGGMRGVAIALIILPMIFWVISFISANLLYHSSISSRVVGNSEYKDIMQFYLGISQWFLIAGLISMLLILVLYIIAPGSEKASLQIQVTV